MSRSPHAFSMPNPLKNLHFKNEFLISSRIFLKKVAQKIEQKNAEQAHMTINQYLITKGTETTPQSQLPTSKCAFCQAGIC